MGEFSCSVPVSVIVCTKNEEQRISACLEKLTRFDDVWVVDSNSEDETQKIARAMGARVEHFVWDGRYPKKRQWCLDHLDLKYRRVFFVDADEHVTDALVDEIAALDWACAGYFVRGRWEFEGRILRHGLCNNKLVVVDKRRVVFPVVDDLDIAGMGEMEGHYQPILRAGNGGGTALGQLRAAMVHQAHADTQSWRARHARYAEWEAGMNANAAWPRDPVIWREGAKRVFRALPMRGAVAFLQSYIFKLGVLDGAPGYRFARSRAAYYRMISDASKARARSTENSTTAIAQP